MNYDQPTSTMEVLDTMRTRDMVIFGFSTGLIATVLATSIDRGIVHYVFNVFAGSVMAAGMAPLAAYVAFGAVPWVWKQLRRALAPEGRDDLNGGHAMNHGQDVIAGVEGYEPRDDIGPHRGAL